MILTADKQFLFATNGGDNSASSFSVRGNGKLTLVDVKRTGNMVDGRSGTAKSLAFSPATNTLYVRHSLGPDHLRLMTVDPEGKLTARPEGYTVNTPRKLRRVSTMVVLSPDERFIVVGTTFDEPAEANPDGSPIVSADQGDAMKKSVASNAPDPDGIVVFASQHDSSLGEGMFQDSGGGSPFYPAVPAPRPESAQAAATHDGIDRGRRAVQAAAIGIGTRSPALVHDLAYQQCWRPLW
ncbi:MAG TPA: hypothetical protein VJ914_06650 [Pseudonocardiaceae bacterium]|nr:hypothetical protein [Pseudonocardiaceae bacterium]